MLASYLNLLMALTLFDFPGQWAGQQPTVPTFGSPALRAPEAIISSDFGPKIDLWGVGCLAFELLFGEWLFNPKEAEGQWSFEGDLLAQIIEITGEQFSAQAIGRAGPENGFIDGEGQSLLHDSGMSRGLKTCA